MIDVKEINLADIKIQIQPDEIRESGEHIDFPLDVNYKNGEMEFRHHALIRTVFWEELKTLDHWRNALENILKHRARDEIKRRLQKPKMLIDDKLKLMGDE